MNRDLRAYIILHFKDSKNKTHVLIGRESVVHQKALEEMQQLLSSDNANKQREQMREQLSRGNKMIEEGGRIVSRGPWRGGNFGGLLLIGRSSLPGGRAERCDKTETDTAVRELVEEFRLPNFILEDEGAKNKIGALLKQLCEFKQNRRHEIYYTLDLDEVRKELPEFLKPYEIMTNFQIELENAPSNSLEKWSIFTCAASEMEKEFADELSEAYEMRMKDQLKDLALHICNTINVKYSKDKAVKHLVKEMLRFQKARTMTNAKNVARLFAEKFK